MEEVGEEKSVKCQKASLGRSVWTNFVTNGLNRNLCAVALLAQVKKWYNVTSWHHYTHRVIFNEIDGIPILSHYCVFRGKTGFANHYTNYYTAYPHTKRLIFLWYKIMYLRVVIRNQWQIHNYAIILLFANISLESSKCLFKIWRFNEVVINDKIAMIAMHRRRFRKNAPTSYTEQSCIASLYRCGRLVAHIRF